MGARYPLARNLSAEAARWTNVGLAGRLRVHRVALVRRLLIIAGIALATQTPQVDAARDAIRDVRERQYQAGFRAGCALRTAEALNEQDMVAVREIGRMCAEVRGRPGG